MALSCDPDILILDEVTSALDAFTKKEISDLLRRLQKTADCSMILISHDITFLSAVSSRLAVLYAGRIMELGATSEIIDYPIHPYTRGLINSTPGIFLYRDMWGIPGEAPSGTVSGCQFFGRCTQRIKLAASALSSVGLPTTDEFLHRPCGDLSGGQRQRVAIARALIMRPKLLIADEITASLDVSSAANILRMLKGLQNSRGFAMIYITHDLMIALKTSDRIAVMDGGRIIETGNSHHVMLYPRQEATKRLVGARILRSSPEEIAIDRAG